MVTKGYFTTLICDWCEFTDEYQSEKSRNEIGKLIRNDGWVISKKTGLCLCNACLETGLDLNILYNELSKQVAQND